MYIHLSQCVMTRPYYQRDLYLIYHGTCIVKITCDRYTHTARIKLTMQVLTVYVVSIKARHTMTKYWGILSYINCRIAMCTGA